MVGFWFIEWKDQMGRRNVERISNTEIKILYTEREKDKYGAVIITELGLKVRSKKLNRPGIGLHLLEFFQLKFRFYFFHACLLLLLGIFK